jgi:oligopeptide/dipeptide ABC transporter ATP-binding protein
VPRVEQAGHAPLPELDKAAKQRLMADVPSPANPPPGCHFHTRCPQAVPACKVAYPAEVSVSTTHKVRCILVQPV